MTNITKGNILICEYMGVEFIPYKDNSSYNKSFNTYKKCKKWIKNNAEEGYVPAIGWNQNVGDYHRNWASLMPVVEKINTYEYEDGELAFIRTFGQYNKEGLPMVRINRMGLFTSETLIQATYLAVVNFLSSIKE